MRRIVFLAAVATMMTASSTRAQVVAGDTLVYDNNSTGFSGTGATVGAGGTAAQGTVTITSMFSDDITTAAGAGGQSIVGAKFAVGNFGANSVSVRPRVRFYANDNGGTAPGTEITGFSFAPIIFTGGTISTVSFTLAAGQLVIPANGQFWAGLLYDNSGGTAAAADMQSFGVGFFTNPTVGSSTSEYFLSPAPASGSYLSNNPTGTAQTTANGGSLGWQFETATPVPEPGSIALCGFAVCGMTGWWRRRRAG